MVYEKTACLIAASGRFGATFSGADEEQIERLSRLGGIVGTAFQISDDIIDIDSDPDESGKVPGTDLREGVHTLPVLYALREYGPGRGSAAAAAEGPGRGRRRPGRGAAAAAQVARAWSQAKDTVARYAAQARDELANLPDGPGPPGAGHAGGLHGRTGTADAIRNLRRPAEALNQRLTS